MYEKSRRVGISWAEASDGALYSVNEEEDDTCSIGFNQNVAREFIGGGALRAKHLDLAALAVEETVFENEGLEVKDKLRYRIKFAKRHEGVARGLHQVSSPSGESRQGKEWGCGDKKKNRGIRTPSSPLQKGRFYQLSYSLLRRPKRP